jgi:hypothetical protein
VIFSKISRVNGPPKSLSDALKHGLQVSSASSLHFSASAYIYIYVCIQGTFEAWGKEGMRNFDVGGREYEQQEREADCEYKQHLLLHEVVLSFKLLLSFDWLHNKNS